MIQIITITRNIELIKKSVTNLFLKFLHKETGNYLIIASLIGVSILSMVVWLVLLLNI